MEVGFPVCFFLVSWVFLGDGRDQEDDDEILELLSITAPSHKPSGKNEGTNEEGQGNSHDLEKEEGGDKEENREVKGTQEDGKEMEAQKEEIEEDLEENIKGEVEQNGEEEYSGDNENNDRVDIKIEDCVDEELIFTSENREEKKENISNAEEHSIPPLCGDPEENGKYVDQIAPDIEKIEIESVQDKNENIEASPRPLYDEVLDFSPFLSTPNGASRNTTLIEPFLDENNDDYSNGLPINFFLMHGPQSELNQRNGEHIPSFMDMEPGAVLEKNPEKSEDKGPLIQIVSK